MLVTIDAVLQQKDKTRYWLSQKTKINYQNLAKLCNGETKSISFDYIDKICNALECKPNDIFEITIDD